MREYTVSITLEIYVAVRKSVKSAQPPRQRWEEESRCSLSRSPEDGQGGTGSRQGCEERWAHVSAPRKKIDIFVFSSRDLQCAPGGPGGSGTNRPCLG